MAIRTAKVRNSAGIHCRPSAVIIKETAHYPGSIKIQAETGDADLKSIYGLLCLALETGTQLAIEVTGPDEEAWADKLVELFERHYDFPPRDPQAAESATPAPASPAGQETTP